MINQNTTSISASLIFSSILDGYSASRLAEEISHSDTIIGYSIATDAINSFQKSINQEKLTDLDNKNMIVALDWVLDGRSDYDISSDYNIPLSDVNDYLLFIKDFYIKQDH